MHSTCKTVKLLVNLALSNQGLCCLRYRVRNTTQKFGEETASKFFFDLWKNASYKFSIYGKSLTIDQWLRSNK